MIFMIDILVVNYKRPFDTISAVLTRPLFKLSCDSYISGRINWFSEALFYFTHKTRDYLQRRNGGHERCQQFMVRLRFMFC